MKRITLLTKLLLLVAAPLLGNNGDDDTPNRTNAVLPERTTEKIIHAEAQIGFSYA